MSSYREAHSRLFPTGRKSAVGIAPDGKSGSLSQRWFVEALPTNKELLIRPSFNYIKGQLDDIRADVLFLGIAGLAKADPDTEKTFFRETIEKTGAKLVIPIHWDNFFSPLDRPIKGMPHIIENTGVAFFRTAKYCELHDVNFLIQYPRTSIEI